MEVEFFVQGIMIQSKVRAVCAGKHNDADEVVSMLTKPMI